MAGEKKKETLKIALKSVTWGQPLLMIKLPYFHPVFVSVRVSGYIYLTPTQVKQSYVKGGMQLAMQTCREPRDPTTALACPGLPII